MSTDVTIATKSLVNYFSIQKKLGMQDVNFAIAQILQNYYLLFPSTKLRNPDWETSILQSPENLVFIKILETSGCGRRNE